MTRRPSTCTVQAPQEPRSQPFLVPVRPQLLAQRVEQRGARLDRQRVAPAVHLKHDIAIPGVRTGAALVCATAACAVFAVAVGGRPRPPRRQ